MVDWERLFLGGFLAPGAGNQTSEPVAEPVPAGMPAQAAESTADPASEPAKEPGAGPIAGAQQSGARPLLGRVIDQRGLAVAGAAVELLHSELGTVAEAITDGRGNFSLAPVSGRDALYRVRVWAAGYRLAESPWAGVWDPALTALSLTAVGGELRGRVESGLAPVSGALVSLLVGRGEIVAEARSAQDGSFVLSAPARQYTLLVTAAGYAPWTGTAQVADGGVSRVTVPLTQVGAKVRGVLVDSVTAEPLVGARVELLRTGYGVLQATATESDGAFAFTVAAITEAQYRVRAWAPEHAVTVSNAFAALPGTTVEFRAGERLQAAPAYATVLGSVIDASGVPVRGAEVLLDAKGIGVVATTGTDDAGAFRFSTVPTGGSVQYRVRIIPQFQRLVDSGWFTPAGGEVRNFGLLAPQGVPLNADSYGLIFGRITDAAGRPLAGARVAVEREAQRIVAWGETGADGTYRVLVRSNPAGTGYLVRAEKEGYLPSGQIAGSTTDLVTVPTNGMVQVNITLYSALVNLEGRVVDADGYPVYAAEVVLYRQGVGATLRTSTDANGMYRFKDLPRTGVPSLLVETARDGKAADSGGTGGATLLDPGIAQGLIPTLSLPDSGVELRGRVTDARRSPVADARVVVTLDGETREVRSGFDGDFVLGGIRAGAQATLRVEAPGLVAVAGGPLTVSATTPEQTFVLRPATGSVRGRVVDRSGRPVAGARVELLQDGRGLVDATVTDAAGLYALPAAPAGGGGYTLRVRSDLLGVSSLTNLVGDLVPLFTVWPQPAERDLVLPGRP